MHMKLPEPQLERSPSTTSASSDSEDERPGAPIEAEAIVHRAILPETVNASSSDDDDDDDDDDSKEKKRKNSSNSKGGEIEYLYNQDFCQLRDACLAEGDTLFEDPEFPPDMGLLRLGSKRVEDDVEWLRPHEYLRPEAPMLVSERNEGFNIKSSLDSWFVPAMSAIAESESLLRRVVPNDQGFTEDAKYAGIFHFRFWFGRWIDIVVDDRIPVRKGCPLYMRSASNLELWPTLLEKAYAKAKGSYELLNRWLPVDGCIELTGGVPERVRNLPSFLSEEASEASERLFFDLIRASQMGNIILAVLPSPGDATTNKFTSEASVIRSRLSEANQLGLEPRYVYRITQVANLGHGHQVIRVKNCSGPKSIKWIGAWNHADTRWANVSEFIRKELDSETYDDGGFWMAYGDFLKYFQTLDICHISTDIDQEVTFHGRWEKGLNAGGVAKGDFKNYAKNPQCFVRLNDSDPHDVNGKSSAIISLMQRRQPHSRVKGMNKIGFKVFWVEPGVEELNAPFFSYRRNDGGHKCVAKTPTWQDGRELNIRVRLPMGKYCIIPSTLEKDQEGDFILRVHIERYSREIKEELKQLEVEEHHDKETSK